MRNKWVHKEQYWTMRPLVKFIIFLFFLLEIFYGVDQIIFILFFLSFEKKEKKKKSQIVHIENLNKLLVWMTVFLLFFFIVEPSRFF